jgi:hypothetical protein
LEAVSWTSLRKFPAGDKDRSRDAEADTGLDPYTKI